MAAELTVGPDRGRQEEGCLVPGRARLRRQDRQGLARTVWAERVDRPGRPGHRKHQHVPGPIDAEVDRVERRVTDDLQAGRPRPREDALLVAIDEIERARRVHRRARDRVEVAGELLDRGLQDRHRRLVGPIRRRQRRVQVEDREQPLAHLATGRHVLERVVEGELARAQLGAAVVGVADAVAVLGVHLDVAEADAARSVDADRGRERVVAAGDAVGAVVGDRDVLRVADLEGDGLGARRHLFLRLRRVELPVLDPIQLDLAVEVMLGRQLVDDAGRRGVGDVEPRLRVRGGAPDGVERPAAALGHPDARVLGAPPPATARAGRARREPVDHDVAEKRLAAGHPQDRGGARVGRAGEDAEAADDRAAALRRLEQCLRLADTGEGLDPIRQIDPASWRDGARSAPCPPSARACRGRRRCRSGSTARGGWRWPPAAPACRRSCRRPSPRATAR